MLALPLPLSVAIISLHYTNIMEDQLNLIKIDFQQRNDDARRQFLGLEFLVGALKFEERIQSHKSTIQLYDLRQQVEDAEDRNHEITRLVAERDNAIQRAVSAEWGAVVLKEERHCQ